MDAQGHHKGLFTKNHQVLRHGSMVRHWARVYLDEARPKIPGGHPDDLLFFAGNEIRGPNLYTFIIAIVSGSHHQPTSKMELKRVVMFDHCLFLKNPCKKLNSLNVASPGFLLSDRWNPQKKGMHAVKRTAKVMQNDGWETTPPKAMTMENQPFEDVSASNGGFSIAMLVFGGVLTF